MQAERSQLNFDTALTFINHNEIYENERPYSFKVPLDGTEVPSSNIDNLPGVPAHVVDMRGSEGSFSLAKNGFSVFEVQDKLSYEDYHDEIRVQGYFREVEAMLKEHLIAKTVKVFRHAIRKRHMEWPRNTQEIYDYDQPATSVHIDTTPREVYQEVSRHHGGDFEQLTKSRIQWINFWKPLKGPLNDWPLLLCDNSTVDREKDLEPADVIYPDRVAENCLVYHSDKFKWYYLSSHKTNEIIAFVQGDTLRNAAPGVPHCSVPNPHAPANEAPRESIEARCLVFYGP